MFSRQPSVTAVIASDGHGCPVPLRLVSVALRLGLQPLEMAVGCSVLADGAAV